MYLLDTNVLAELRAGKPKASLRVQAWAASVPLSMQYVSPICFLEIDIGIRRLERRVPPQGKMLRLWLDQLRKLFAARILSIDDAVAQRCASLHVPDKMPEHDALIAATALAHGMTLITRNVKDFERTGVKLLNPWEAS